MIRARLLAAWPNLSHYFGIHPWDVPKLTIQELNEYMGWLKDLGDRQRKQQRDQARRPRRR
jgi:hypothetical protein